MDQLQKIIDHGNSPGRSTSLPLYNSKVNFSLPKMGTMSKCKISVFISDEDSSSFLFKSKEDDFDIEDKLKKILFETINLSSWFIKSEEKTYDFIFSSTPGMTAIPQLRIKFNDLNTWGIENNSLVTLSSDASSVSGQIIKISGNNASDIFYVYFKFETFSYTGLDIDTHWARLKVGNGSSNSGQITLTSI